MKLCKNAYNREDVDFTKVETTVGNIYMKRLLREPAGHLTLEEFRPGEDVAWPFWHHEVHVIVSGRAELTVASPPALKTNETFLTEAGDAYMIHRGDVIRFRVMSDEPYRHLCIVIPAIPVPSGDHLLGDHIDKIGRY